MKFFATAQIVFIHQPEDDIHIVDVIAEVGRNDLLSTFGELIEIEEADGANGLFGIVADAAADQERSSDENDHESNAADDDLAHKFSHRI